MQPAHPGDGRRPAAFVFAGQGSQRPGMAEAWRDHPAARRWQEADDVLGMPVARLGLAADEIELREPLACQLAIFVHQAVVWEAWAGVLPAPRCVAGHSLGEYNALLAAGVLDFAQALRLVHARALATAAAAERAPGGMAACVGFATDQVERAARLAGGHVCNDNAPGQLVVAGGHAALDELARLLADGPGRVLRLDVGAAYHSPAMETAVPPFLHALGSTEFRAASAPVIANVDASPRTHPDDWPGLLARQLTHPVRWRESVLAMRELGVEEVVEFSASPVLTGMVKRTDRTLARTAVSLPPVPAVST